jgi:hypothetical protein
MEKRCCHGPAGRLSGLKSTAELNRPQTGGYNDSENARARVRNRRRRAELVSADRAL